MKRTKSLIIFYQFKDAIKKATYKAFWLMNAWMQSTMSRLDSIYTNILPCYAAN